MFISKITERQPVFLQEEEKPKWLQVEAAEDPAPLTDSALGHQDPDGEAQSLQAPAWTQILVLLPVGCENPRGCPHWASVCPTSYLDLVMTTSVA